MVLALSIGIFLIGFSSVFLSPERISQEEILGIAEELVPEPTLPPRPEGQTVTETVFDKACDKVLTVRGLKIHNKTVCRDVPKTIEKFVEVSSKQMADWESEVQKIQQDRHRRLQEKISELVREENLAFRAYIKDLIQIFSGIFGILFGVAGLFFALRRDRREQAEE